jgi:NAD(P)H-hydrate repair Nnr-like enzyme with NAD(P)H-hydrate epimerase domain/8-oxo-dGTP pyrophosphatase MutT (NUDIX family)
MSGADVWRRLVEGLGEPDGAEHAGGGRLGAALALVREVEGDHELVYTRRRDDLRTHPGQISFPGGRVDPGEGVTDAAVREAAEEVGLRPGSATVLGALPTFYIPPSRFWLQTVVARWDRPHPLVAAEDEVAEIVRARVTQLTDRERWRAVRLSAGGWSWAWQLDGDHVLWGATAVSTAALLQMLAPGWDADVTLAELGAEREVRPWLAGRGRGTPPVVLAGVPSRTAHTAPAPLRGPPRAADAEALARAAAEIVQGLAAHRVAVLVGGGGNGIAGLVTARRLAAHGLSVDVVLDREHRRMPPANRRLLDGLDTVVLPDELPRADVYVDALVGGGLSGPLRGGARDLVHALRRCAGTVVALDLPSGLHAVKGLVGDCVTASASLAPPGGPPPGALQPGLEPFVGDLYTVDEEGRLWRLVRPEPAGWRE